MVNDLPKYVFLIVHALVERQDREQILGNLVERYHAKISTEGEKAAKRWLRHDLATSVMPFLLFRLYKLLQVLIVLAKALDLIQKRD